MQILTQRLRLVPASVDSMKAEIAGAKKLATFLDVRLPKAWPPPFNDLDSQRWMLRYLESHARSRWGMWYIVLRGRERQLIGNCGFKGEPLKHTVELGYAIAPEFHRRGYATEAVRGLLRHAFEDPAVHRVLGETLPELVPSIGVLRKCGFRRVTGASEPGNLRFSITRRSYELGRKFLGL